MKKNTSWIWLVIIATMVGIIILVNKSQEKATRDSVTALANRVAETSASMNSRFKHIKTLISEHGTPGEYLSASAVSQAELDQDQNLRKSMGLGGVSPRVKELKKVLKQLEKDHAAFQNYLSAETKTVYDTLTTLIYFCNDAQNPIKETVFQHIPENQTTPFLLLSAIANPENAIRLVSSQDGKYYSNASSILNSYLDQLEYVNNLEYIMFVKYSCFLKPTTYLMTGIRGAVSVNVDVYRIEDKSFVESFKVFAESSGSISTYMMVSQGDLDRDIQKNLERKLKSALTLYPASRG